jgi:protease IV
MKSFFKYLLATIVGVVISAIIVVVIFAIYIGSLVSSAEKEVVVKNNSILQLKFDKPIPERSSDNPFENFDFANFKTNPIIGLHDILKQIEKAKTDPNIKGIYLDLGSMPVGFAVTEELRNAILNFKTSKKFVIAYAEYYSKNTYYLATAADSIFINPAGAIPIYGMSSEVLFYKGLLDKLGIEAQIIRHGKFKSAVEPFMSDKMSGANKEQLSTLLNSVWGHITEEIAKSRKITTDSLNYWLDNMSITSPASALRCKLIDGIRYQDEVLTSLTRLSGAKSEKKLEFVSLSDYKKSIVKETSFSKNKIALIYAEGQIISGESDKDNIGSETLSKSIREARTDSSIKAIVLRINSPGGSALASDVMWRELTLAAKAKPLIVSMGSLAASGGYYIAAPADTIVAEPTTITGSIGVFGMLFNAKGFLNNKLGITSEVVSTNKHSSIGSPFRPLAPEEKNMIQAEIESIYDTFISHVAEGRNLTKTKVDSIGQGRVWSALDAQKLGLVDLIGGIDTAINIAVKKAKLKDFRIVELPKKEDGLANFLEGFSSHVKYSLIDKELGENAQFYYDAKKLQNLQGIQMLMPYELNLY